jgi:hypothetical protein
MARIANRTQFKKYVLSKLGQPILDLPIQISEIDECATTSSTGASGTPGTSGTNVTAVTGMTGDPQCQAFAASVSTQLDHAIDDALDYFQEFASDLGNEKAVLYIPLEHGKKYYDVPPCVVAIEQPMNHGASYAMDREESTQAVGLFSLQSQFGPRGVFSYLGAGSSDTLLTYDIAMQYNALVDLRYTIKFQIEFNELSKKILIFPNPRETDTGRVLALMCSIKVTDEKCFNSLWLQIGRNLSMYTGLQILGGGAFNADFYWGMGREDKNKLEEELRNGAYGNAISASIFLQG